MNTGLKEKCDLLVKNRKTITSTFAWESGLMSLAAATLYTRSGLTVDKEKLKECEATIKAKTSALSEFRGNVKMPLICKMALSDNPKKYFEQVEVIYKLLNKSKWLGNEYKIMAAITICDYADESDYEQYVSKTNEIYSRMKQEHKWLTSDEDIPFAAMLAVSGLDVDKLIDEMELNYKILKRKFHDSNAVQSLSHILALDEQPAEVKCAKVEAVFNELKAMKHSFGTGYELATLGTLAMLDIQEKEVANLIAETDDYLKEQKGFGNFALGAKERRLYAAQLVLNQYGSEDTRADGVVLGSMLALTVAIQICLILCITSCIAASTANN